MYTAHTHLDIYLGLYFWPISLQMESGPEPQPKDVDGSVNSSGKALAGERHPSRHLIANLRSYQS